MEATVALWIIYQANEGGAAISTFEVENIHQVAVGKPWFCILISGISLSIDA